MAKKPSGGDKARSAKSGRYVTDSYAKKHPSTTVVESSKKPGGSPGGTKKKK